MKFAPAPAPGPESAFGRLDARWKVAALVLAGAAVTCLHGPGPCLAALTGAGALALLARLPLTWVVKRLAAGGLLVALVAVALLFLPGPGPSWQVGPLRVGAQGVESAARLALKALALMLLVLVLVGTTPLPQAFKAANSLGVPGVLVHVLALTYRYLFLMAEELARVRTALRVRGYRNRARMHSYRTVGHVAGALLVRSAERAERVGQALRCRGFDGRFRALGARHTGPREVAFFALVGGAAVALAAWDLVLGGAV